MGSSDRDACFRVDGDLSRQIHTDLHVDSPKTSGIECSTIRNVSAIILNELELFNKPFSVHMNCEGCEFEVVQSLIETGLISRVRVLQFGSHRVDFVQNPVYQYCSLRLALLKTHNLLWAEPWAWERWVLKSF